MSASFSLSKEDVEEALRYQYIDFNGKRYHTPYAQLKLIQINQQYNQAVQLDMEEAPRTDYNKMIKLKTHSSTKAKL